MIHEPTLQKTGNYVFVDYRLELNELYLKVKKLEKEKNIGELLNNCFSAYDWICETEKEMLSKMPKGSKSSDEKIYHYILKKY